MAITIKNAKLEWTSVIQPNQMSGKYQTDFYVDEEQEKMLIDDIRLPAETTIKIKKPGKIEFILPLTGETHEFRAVGTLYINPDGTISRISGDVKNTSSQGTSFGDDLPTSPNDHGANMNFGNVNS